MQPLLPMIKVKCESNHEWKTVISPWWFSVQDIKCPECEGQAVAAIWGGLQRLCVEDEK